MLIQKRTFVKTFKNQTMKKLFSILVVAALAIFVVSCGGGAKPEATAEQYLKHLAEGEFDKAGELGTKDTKDLLNMLKTFSGGQKPEKKNEVKDVKCTVEAGDSTAVCSYCCNDKGENGTLKMLKVDGKWMVNEKKEMPAGDMGGMPGDTTNVSTEAPVEEPAK